jgi:putative heme-binding domain-containing protein
VDFELHIQADLNSDKVRNARPVRGTFDLPDARIVAPEDPHRSVIYYRMVKFGSGRMPHLGSEFVDPEGTELLFNWLNGSSKLSRPASDLTADQIEADLRSFPTADSLARLVRTGQAPAGTRSRILQTAASLPPGTIRDLFEGYLHDGSQERRLGPAPRPRAILALKGDSARGKELFHATKSQCANCHKIDGQGFELGPDLSRIGSTRPRDFILESLVDPSRRVESQHQAYLLRTHDGRTATGLLVRRSDKEVVIRDNQKNELRIAVDNVELLQPARESFMPAGLLAEFTPQQAADLLEYLSTRK